MLIRTYYSDTSITVTLYGDNDGRTVREENRTISNPVPVTDKTFACPASADGRPEQRVRDVERGRGRTGFER